MAIDAESTEMLNQISDLWPKPKLFRRALVLKTGKHFSRQHIYRWRTAGIPLYLREPIRELIAETEKPSIVAREYT